MASSISSWTNQLVSRSFFRTNRPSSSGWQSRTSLGPLRSNPFSALVIPHRHSLKPLCKKYSSHYFGCRAYFTSKKLNDTTNGSTENPFENDATGYQNAVKETMHELVEKCEELEHLNLPGFDVIEKDGVFELNLGEKGIYVINKQAPNRQLWWSSPVSGPKRYSYDITSKAWRNTRDGHFMFDQLNSELSSLLGQPFDIYTVAKKPTIKKT